MAVYVAYSDESGTADPRGAFLVGGFAAPEEDWPYFNSSWRERVLDGPPRIPYLHMTDIRNEKWRNDNSLTFNDAAERQAEAVRVIRSSGGLVATAARLNRSEFQDMYQGNFRAQGLPVEKGVADPDYLCFMAYLTHLLAYLYINRPDVTRVNFRVAKKEKVTRRVEEFFECYKRRAIRPLANLAGDFEAMDAKAVEGLNAADMLLWHLQRHYAGTLRRHDEYRLALIGETPGTIYEYSGEDMEAMGSRLVVRALDAKAKQDAGKPKKVYKAAS